MPSIFLVSVLAFGCVGGDPTTERQRSAELIQDTGIMAAFAPAYYSSTSQAATSAYWPEGEQDLQTGTIVVNGPNNGPPATGDPLGGYIDHFAQAYGNYGPVDVLGYVNNGWGQTTDAVTAAIDAWVGLHTDGVMFDVSQRCDNPPQAGCNGATVGVAGDPDLARAEYLVQYALQSSFGYWKDDHPAYVVFNWGTPYPYMGNRYVDCLYAAAYAVQAGGHGNWNLQFIVRETTEQMYMAEDAYWDIDNGNGSGWNWIWDYYPTMFIHLVHNYTGAHSFADIAAKAASRSAGSIFVTDQIPDGTWNAPPADQIFATEGTPFEVTYTFNEAAYTARTDCPVPQRCPPGYPGC
ncbi:MAG: hypothetical protein ACJ8F1_06560 [Polyangia bacterium]